MLRGIKMKKKSPVVHTILTFAIIVTIVFLANKLDLVSKFKLHEVIKYVRRKGSYGELTFILLIFLKSFIIIIPASIFTVAGAILFGAVKGFLLNILGFFISGTSIFYLARFLGKGFLDKILKGKMLKLDKRLEHNGFKVMFFLRAVPIFPYDLLSAVSGVSNIKYKDFILGSVLGVIPETLCYSLITKGFGAHSRKLTMLMYLTIILIIIITVVIYKRSSKIIKLDEEESING
jgi:uncharacterized membrane protein YdjX (TVP38/TMEM64 family)